MNEIKTVTYIELTKKERRVKNLKKALKNPWYYIWFLFIIIFMFAIVLISYGFLASFNQPLSFGGIDSTNLNVLTGNRAESLFEIRNIIVEQQNSVPGANYLQIWEIAVSGFSLFMVNVLFLFVYQIMFFVFSNNRGVNPLDIFE